MKNISFATGCWLLAAVAFAQGTRAAPPPPGAATVMAYQGNVEVQRAENVPWDPAYTNQSLVSGNRLRTDKNSHAMLRFTDLETVRIGPRSLIRIESKAERKRGFDFFRGVLYFFHRDKPEEFEVRTPQMAAIIRGTEFTLEVGEDETTTLSLLDGDVRLSNPQDATGTTIDLRTGEQAIIEPGKAPRRTAIIEAVNLVQWALYYPAVLNLDELSLADGEKQALNDSLAAYRAGDLLAALAAYPAQRQVASDEERVYLAALLLSVGGVAEAGEHLAPLLAPADTPNRPRQLARALQKLVSAVKYQVDGLPTVEDSATSLLVESYYQQSRSKLPEALAAAQKAVAVAPDFAFGWARVAELEFGFGRVPAARAAIEKSLQLAPRNAAALALRAFLLAAANRVTDALEAFDQAINIDPALGQAWLGRGLCRIRHGEALAGRADLQMAATLEPNRAAFRSYLGKAFSQVGDSRRAERELILARKLDANDPTAWLYSALLKQQENRVNEAVRDLERSQELNDNRQVYRSRLLLDQDQAVRGANLATLYEDAGMVDVSAREASRAVSLDYANYSAHLFLANSYNALRDPRQINLRYETPWLSEYLVANLLAPVQAGTLSPFVTQQDYGRLFERDRFGISSATEYLSRGDWIQSAVQYGILGNFSYSTEVYYRSENGQRPNNDLDQLTASFRFKQQITPQDSVFVQVTYYHAETGDVTPYYDPAQANQHLRTKETQEPLALVGYHHQWSPGVDTLFLGGRLQDTFEVSNPQPPYPTPLVLEQRLSGGLASAIPVAVGQEYRSEVVVYTAEVLQMFQHRPHTLLVGARYQDGGYDVRNQPNFTAAGVAPYFRAEEFNPDGQHIEPEFNRLTGYGYYYLQLSTSFVWIAGVSYDQVTVPVNFRFAPLVSGEETTEQVSPKLGFMYTPLKDTTIRMAYSQSLGGAAFDQSFQLEPSQIAGFNQAYRSMIPEAVAGANSAAQFEIFGVAWDQRFGRGTYLGVSGEWLRSDVDRVVGAYNDDSTNVVNLPPYINPTSTRQSLNYAERSLTVVLNQLLGNEWSLGVRYRLSRAELEDRYNDIEGTPTPPGISLRNSQDATLHNLLLYGIYTHPSGFFARGEALWFSQENHGYSGAYPGDDFWQFNAHVGYRFPKRRAEVRVGLLNITDQDYRLNPLNLTPELPRDITFVTSFRFNF